MTTPQQYFLILVIVTFIVFAVSLAASYIHYRRWLRSQPLQVHDRSLPHGLQAADD